jgi:hypothetical protein
MQSLKSASLLCFECMYTGKPERKRRLTPNLYIKNVINKVHEIGKFCQRQIIFFITWILVLSFISDVNN